MNHLDAQEQKERMIAEAGYKCYVCNKPVTFQTAQLAHVIEKSKSNLKKYGEEVIHHPLNMKVVCSLKCNSACLMSPKTHPIQAQDLIERIEGALHDGS